MVKKTSFLERLFRGRKASASARSGNAGLPLSDKKGERISVADQAGVDGKPRGNGSSNKPDAAAVTPAENQDGGEGKGLSRILGGGRREEAAVALTDGFKDLSSLLTGIKDRMDQQSKTSGELLGKLAGLPNLLEGIHNSLEKQAKAEERSEKTLSDFRSTMNQIHQSIGSLSTENKAAMKQTTESFERSNSRTTRVFEESQKHAYKAFEKTQSAQIEQIGKLVQRSGKMNGMLVFLLIALVVSMVVMISILAGK